jgi:hypothetical protein
MSNKYSLETQFIVPDEMDEENVRHVLSQFFGDLVRTERFIDARIVEDSSMDEAQVDALYRQLEQADGQAVRARRRLLQMMADDTKSAE